MNELKVPGLIYSLLTAIGVFFVEYFTSGDGSASLIAPLIVAAVPIILKAITVQTGPAELTRGMGGPATSKMRKWVLGG